MGERRFKGYEREQGLLLPPSLDEWLPEGHLSRFISDTVDALDLREWERAYATETGSGAPSFHPVMMLKVLVYGYATGTFSSRKLAAKCVDDVAFRYLSAQARPDFRSLLKFRKRHLLRFETLFVQVVQLAQEAGLVKLGRIALDGSKLKANASKHKAMSYERMCEGETKLTEEIHALLERAQTTDPDSRIMRDGATKGFVQAFNTQIVVDDAHQIIVATELDNQASDQGHLLGMLEAVKETTGAYPEQALADAGYKSEETFKALDKHPTDVYVACGREAYDPRIPVPSEPLPDNATETQRMERKLLTSAGRTIYRKRKSIVEPVFGWVKNVLGFRQLSLRGQANARGEWHLVCLALNLRRMAAMT